MKSLQKELKVEELNEEQLKNIEGGMTACKTYRLVEGNGYPAKSTMAAARAGALGAP